ncbi:hypothetical protein NW767_015361 [Fusarium falciforme]|nr:hypothetical protein NW767_015361 [Fusarium falciforme]
MDATSVDLILVRHEEAISNVDSPHEEAIDIKTISESEARDLMKTLHDGTGDSLQKFRIDCGDFYPDALTEEGKARASQGLPTPVDNVYIIISTSCLRGIQTAGHVSESFRLVGSRSTKDGNLLLHCDNRIREATNWPQDHAPVTWTENGRTYASYIRVRGGEGTNAGEVLGLDKFDLTNTTWFGNSPSGFSSMDGLMNALKNPRSLGEVEKGVDGFLKDLHSTAQDIAKEHHRSKRGGVPKIVIVMHGGIFSLIRRKWTCNCQWDSADSAWKWAGSSVLRNGDISVYKFHSSGPDHPLVEVAWDESYKEAFGCRYRNLTRECEDGTLRIPDDSEVDHRGGHADFIERTGVDVVRVIQRQEESLRTMFRAPMTDVPN